MNIFFFGGTFDPPHKAHKLIYKYCINLCDKFIFIPTSQSPGKYQPTANTKDRIKMLELLIDEKENPHSSYTQLKSTDILVEG